MRPNLNLGADNLAASVVACSFCGAQVSQPCRTLTSHRGKPAGTPTHLPHKARIKLGVVTRMKEGR